MYRALTILTTIFGYDRFRPHQKEIIDAIAKGQDALAVMPTGAGKSLCYQIPALTLPGMTLVISPLISLMKDQVQVLQENGVAADYLNSSLTTPAWADRMNRLEEGRVKLLYVAPERLMADGFMERIARSDVSLVAVDEAHCISQWGHDFRPSYRNIGTLLGSLPKRPVIAAFTATATEKVRTDIIEQLSLQSPFIKITGFDRPNLYFKVERNVDKDAYLLANLKKDESAIVYCSTRKAVEEVHALLTGSGLRVGKYHAGMNPEERQAMQDDFLYDKTEIMVATVAFGMGIDKPDVRKVIHYNLPGSIENYYQEAGRAGRDGDPAEVVLLYAPSDIYTQRFLLERSGNAGDTQKLNRMVDYAESTDCLRHRLLNYFREESSERCGYCGNCDGAFIEEEITLDAQMIISCVHRCGERFGAGIIADVLTGSRAQKVLQFGLNRVSTYNLMPNRTKKEIMQRIDLLTARGYLTRTDDRFPILKLNEKSREVLAPDAKIILAVREETRHLLPRKGDPQTGLTAAGRETFELLRKWRAERAQAEQVPAYVIASNRTLLSVLAVLPQTHEELLRVHGIGQGKADRIGEDLLQFVRDNTEENVRYAEELETVHEKPVRKPKKTGGRQLATWQRYTDGETVP